MPDAGELVLNKTPEHARCFLTAVANAGVRAIAGIALMGALNAIDEAAAGNSLELVVAELDRGVLGRLGFDELLDFLYGCFAVMRLQEVL